MYIELDLKDKDIEAIDRAHNYVNEHFELSSKNPHDREHITMLLRLAELVLRG
jgi:hypothetical protein